MMESKNAGVVMIDSSKEKSDKLRKKWGAINDVSNGLINISTSGFVVSLLSPFDFEGPVVEIVTAVLAGGGFVMKKVSESKLNKLNNRELLDQNDKQTLLTVSKNVSKIYNENKISKSR